MDILTPIRVCTVDKEKFEGETTEYIRINSLVSEQENCEDS